MRHLLLTALLTPTAGLLAGPSIRPMPQLHSAAWRTPLAAAWAGERPEGMARAAHRADRRQDVGMCAADADEEERRLVAVARDVATSPLTWSAALAAAVGWAISRGVPLSRATTLHAYG